MFKRKAPKSKSRSKKRLPKVVLTSKDADGPALKKYVADKATWAWSTVVPAVLAGVAFIKGTIIDFDPVTIFFGLMFASGAISSWFYYWYIKGEEIAQGRVAEVKNQLGHRDTDKVNDIKENCVQAGFKKGTKEARELTESYERCIQALDEKGDKVIGAQEFRLQAQTSYKQGIMVLSHALARYKVNSRVPIEQLREELEEYKADFARLEGETDSASKKESKALDIMVSSHQERVKRYRQLEQEIMTLLSQSNDIEGALETTASSIASLDSSGSNLMESRAAHNLRLKVEAAENTERKLAGVDQSDLYDELEELGDV